MTQTDIQCWTGAQLLNVHHFVAPPRHVFSRRQKEPAELIVVQGGVYSSQLETMTGRKTVTAASGDVVFWPDGVERIDEGDAKHPIRCIAIYFQWPRTPLNLPFVVHDLDHIVDDLAGVLLRVKSDPLHRRLGPEIANAYLTAILAEYARLAQFAEGELVTQVARFTEEHMAESFLLSDLAHHVGMEKRHLERKYKALTGRTPMLDVRRRKAEHVKHMLLVSAHWKLRDLAKRVGLADEHQMSRFLTRYAGASARELKRARRLWTPHREANGAVRSRRHGSESSCRAVLARQDA